VTGQVEGRGHDGCDCLAPGVARDELWGRGGLGEGHEVGVPRGREGPVEVLQDRPSGTLRLCGVEVVFEPELKPGPNSPNLPWPGAHWPPYNKAPDKYWVRIRVRVRVLELILRFCIFKGP